MERGGRSTLVRLEMELLQRKVEHSALLRTLEG